MGPEATAPPTRRDLREHATAPHPVHDDAPAEPVTARPVGPVALGWLDDTALALPATADALAVTPLAADPGADLLASVPRRSIWRPGVLVPSALIALVIAAYAGTTLLWPLHAVAPQVEAVTVQPVAAAVAAPAWPAEGSAAVAVAGIDGVLSTSGDAVPIASITKVVTALLVLENMPLTVGEQGPDFAFTAADNTRYWQYRAAGESALDVPIGGTLTEYQLLEGMLIGSANNYADRLAGNLFPSDAVFADAARSWLSAHSIQGVTIVEPTGIESGNSASPAALIPLAQKAMAHPVIAEIVAKAAVDLPGAGHVENTNDLLADPGVVGIKTGSLDAFNLLAAKDLAIGGATVRVYASVLGQPDDEARDAATRALFAQAEQELQLYPSVPARTVVGEVVTSWGESADVVTATDAAVVLWNGGAATTATEFSLGETADGEAEAGAPTGTLTVTGPLDTATVDLELAGEIEGPSPWWRLTHPLDLFGLAA
jgi:D-alanyl-D-alanine carboxypeptidase (penicillin-binding protein 5/6)